LTRGYITERLFSLVIDMFPHAKWQGHECYYPAPVQTKSSPFCLVFDLYWGCGRAGAPTNGKICSNLSYENMVIIPDMIVAKCFFVPPCCRCLEQSFPPIDNEPKDWRERIFSLPPCADSFPFVRLVRISLQTF
jgi:hypothetical protein